jgi:transposase
MKRRKRSQLRRKHLQGRLDPANVARTGQKKLVSYSLGAIPILDRVLERAKLEDFLKEYVVDDCRCKIAPTRGLILLVKNYLVSRQPIYGVGEWAQQYAPGVLGLSGSQVEFLNDDRAGRCLERLFDADRASLVLSVVRHVVKEFGVSLDELHNDSTTISFFGEYREAFKEGTKRGKTTHAITFGHSKAHRPDLKQLLFILTVARDGAVPLYFNTGNGNLTDDKTHRETWDLLCKLTGRVDFLYVADSKLATKENMAYIAGEGGRFVTVLPKTRKEDTEFRALLTAGAVSWTAVDKKVDEDDPSKIIDVISLADQPARTAEGYRLLWFHSSRKQELDVAARNKSIQRALLRLSELRERLRSPRSRHKQAGNVHAAVEKLLEECGAEKDWIKVTVIEYQEEQLGQEKPGRPGRNTKYVVKKVRERFDLQYEVDHMKVAESAKHDGIFPLVTCDKKLAAEEILRAYKRQPLIEKRFSQFKTDYEVAPVYLKSVARIEALLCVYFFALLIQALLERELRQAMEEEGVASLPLYPEERLCRAPTTTRLIDVFENIQRHTLTTQAGEVTQFVTELSPIQEEILRLLDVPAEVYRR